LALRESYVARGPLRTIYDQALISPSELAA